MHWTLKCFCRNWFLTDDVFWRMSLHNESAEVPSQVTVTHCRNTVLQVALTVLTRSANKGLSLVRSRHFHAKKTFVLKDVSKPQLWIVNTWSEVHEVNNMWKIWLGERAVQMLAFLNAARNLSTQSRDVINVYPWCGLRQTNGHFYHFFFCSGSCNAQWSWHRNNILTEILPEPSQGHYLTWRFVACLKRCNGRMGEEHTKFWGGGG
jgi:hypothetical protein